VKVNRKGPVAQVMFIGVLSVRLNITGLVAQEMFIGVAMCEAE